MFLIKKPEGKIALGIPGVHERRVLYFSLIKSCVSILAVFVVFLIGPNDGIGREFLGYMTDNCLFKKDCFLTIITS